MSHPPSSSDPLGTLLRPRSVAIVGASDNPGKIGGRPLHYLLKHGFQGAVYPISQRGGLVQGVASYPSLEALPQAPDCAILSVPAEAALVQIEACARLGVRNAILFSSGFGEMGSHGLEQQGELLAAARAGGVRLLGPNTIGAANFSCGAILSFASIYQDFQPLDGPVAIVSQSGAVGASAYALLRQNSIGVRYVCTTGNQADIDVCEFMTATLADPAVRLLLLYLEEARNLATLEAGLALARARGVPILVLQGAQSASGARMASCHTGAGGMRDPALSALFDRYSCRRVNGLPELTASVPLYLGSGSTRDAGPGIGIVSNSGASCVMAADACDQMLLSSTLR